MMGFDVDCGGDVDDGLFLVGSTHIGCYDDGIDDDDVHDVNVVDDDVHVSNLAVSRCRWWRLILIKIQALPG